MSKNYSCGTLIKQIHDIMEKNANNILREQELTISQSGVLVLLDEKEGKTASFKVLEKDFGVSQPTMVGIINRLVQKDLVEILTDSEDKRIRKAHLTQKGADKCKEGYKHMNSAEEQLLKSLTNNEKKEFNRLLLKVRKSFD
ncbi:MarR family winged helix-turn-helix transcriptional regulator [Clostridium sp.]